MKKNWRQTRWKDFSASQKVWLIGTCASLAAVLVLSGLSSAEVWVAPDWVVLIVVAIMAVCCFKFLGLTPWALAGCAPEEDEEDDDSDSDDE